MFFAKEDDNSSKFCFHAAYLGVCANAYFELIPGIRFPDDRVFNRLFNRCPQGFPAESSP